MATITDVAKRAGVTVSVASQVLNRKKGTIRISDATKRRIRDAAKALDYVPDVRARLLRQQTSPMIGVLVESIWGSFRPALLNALSEELLKKDKEILLGVHHREAKLAQHHIDMFRTYRTGGVIVISGSDELDEGVFSALKRARRHCGPHVCISFLTPRRDAPTVVIDVRGIMREYVNAVVASGRKTAVFAGLPYRWFEPMTARFRDAVSDHPEVKGVVVRGSSLDHSRFAEEAAPRLRDLCADGPIGVYTPNDLDAIALILRLREMGCRIPEDAAFIGNGDTPSFSAVCRPSLTTFDPLAVMPRMARKAIEILSGPERSNAAEPEECKFLPELVVRESFPLPLPKPVGAEN